jgi:hypothetical protein
MKTSNVLAAMALFSAALYSPEALADALPIPDIDVKGMCLRVAKRVNPEAPSKAMILSCLEDEQRAYNELKTKWKDAPEEAQRSCLSWSSSGYGYIKVCLENEIAAAKNLPAFEFKK